MRSAECPSTAPVGATVNVLFFQLGSNQGFFILSFFFLTTGSKEEKGKSTDESDKLWDRL